VKEGDGVLKIVAPYIRVPIGHSSFELLSTLNIVVFSRIGELGSEVHLCVPSIEETLPLKVDLRGECTCFSSSTLLHDIVVLRGDGTLDTFCLATCHKCQCHGVHSFECSSITCNKLVPNF
jgi:hypothetical protein